MLSYRVKGYGLFVYCSNTAFVVGITKWGAKGNTKIGQITIREKEFGAKGSIVIAGYKHNGHVWITDKRYSAYNKRFEDLPKYFAYAMRWIEK